MNRLAAIFSGVVLALLAGQARADGPLIVDPKARAGYHFSADPIPVYYDLGNLGVVWDYSTATPTQVVFGNDVGARLVRQGYGAWSSVPTAAVGAYVAGDFSAKRLPDIDASNVSRIIGTSNGRGIYVILDTDGSILQDFLGAPDGVLDVSSPQYAIDRRTELTGVNVVARDLSDPCTGANSALTGQLTQGLLGPDGSFVIHGLVPGRRYVLYVDAILAGGFPTPPQWFLPGAEKFYRAGGDSHGSHDDGAGATYDPCA